MEWLMLKKHICKGLGQLYSDSYGHYKTHFDYTKINKKKVEWKSWRNKQKFKNQIWFCISNLANSWKNGKTQDTTNKVKGDNGNFHAKFKTPKKTIS
jgi:hypothetical protein